MKKLIGIGIAVMMVMGLATVANATPAAWTVSLRAGVLSGTTWANAQNATSIGLATTASSSSHASLTSIQAGFYGVDPDPAKMANKDSRAAGQTSYLWNMRLATGASWVSTQALTLAWYIPVVAQSPIKNTDGTAAPAPQWTIKAFRNGQFAGEILDDGLYGSAKNHVIGNYTLTAGMVENWTITATQIVPEPGSMVAMFSGLVGLVGFSVRRRK